MKIQQVKREKQREGEKKYIFVVDNTSKKKDFRVNKNFEKKYGINNIIEMELKEGKKIF